MCCTLLQCLAVCCRCVIRVCSGGVHVCVEVCCSVLKFVLFQFVGDVGVIERVV